MSGKKKWLAVGGVVVVAAAAIWFVFLRGDAPDAVDIDAANQQLDADLAAATQDDAADDGAATDDDDAATGDDGAATDDDDAATGDDGAATDADAPAGFDGDVSGEWIVDDDIGSFDFETASGSFAGFRVDEELTVGAVVAVGRSGGVTGSLTIADGELVAAQITVDMNAIVSNDSRREGAIRRAVGAADHPTATFVLGAPVPLPDGLAEGEVVSIEAAGDLTVNGVTSPTTFSIDALVRDDGLGVVTGSADIVFADFDVTPPSAPIVVSIDDEGIVEFQLVVAKG